MRLAEADNHSWDRFEAIAVSGALGVVDGVAGVGTEALGATNEKVQTAERPSGADSIDDVDAGSALERFEVSSSPDTALVGSIAEEAALRGSVVDEGPEATADSFEERSVGIADSEPYFDRVDILAGSRSVDSAAAPSEEEGSIGVGTAGGSGAAGNSDSPRDQAAQIPRNNRRHESLRRGRKVLRAIGADELDLLVDFAVNVGRKGAAGAHGGQKAVHVLCH